MTVYPKLVALALYILPALSAPSPLLRISKARSPVHGKYIVTLSPGQGERNRDDVNAEAFSNSLSSVSNITHWWEHMSAFAGHFSDDDLDILRADPRVDAIEEDGVVRTLVSVTQCVSFSLCPLSPMSTGLDQVQRSLGFESNLFPEKTCCPGRHIPQLHLYFRQYGRSRFYGVYPWWVPVAPKCTWSHQHPADSGIFTEHPEFQGRAKFGASLWVAQIKSVRETSEIFSKSVGDPTEDRHGHGTHCAGTAISSQLYVALVQRSLSFLLICVLVASTSSGVAKGANAIAVKVIDDNGDGKVSDL